MTDFIVTAHLPRDPNDPIFTGDLAYARAEWTIEHSEAAAKARARRFDRYFTAVAVRPVGKIVRRKPLTATEEVN